MCRKPPWQGDDILVVLIKHWQSTFHSHVRTQRETKLLVEQMDKVRTPVNAVFLSHSSFFLCDAYKSSSSSSWLHRCSMPQGGAQWALATVALCLAVGKCCAMLD